MQLPFQGIVQCSGCPARCRVLLSMTWLIVSIPPSYLFLHFAVFGKAGLGMRVMCIFWRFAMGLAVLGGPAAGILFQ